MEGRGLLDDTNQQNVYKIQKLEFLGVFPKELPEILQGIMQEQEYLSSVARIEDTERVFSKAILFLLIPFFLTLIIFVVVFALNVPSLGYLVFPVMFLLVTPIVIVNSRRLNTKRKKATQKIEAFLEEINQGLYPRGIMWVYVPKKGKRNPSYINVIFLNRGKTGSDTYGTSTEMPHPSTSGGGTTDTTFTDTETVGMASYNLQTYPPSASSYVPPSMNPSSPPTDKFTSTIITPEEPSAPSAPSYSGDPTMFTVID